MKPHWQLDLSIFVCWYPCSAIHRYIVTALV